MDRNALVSAFLFISTLLFSLKNLEVLCNDCLLPGCFPMGTSIPGGLLPSETPQMVILNFHSSIPALYYQEYSNLLQNRKNPNGCNIRATFFVSHDYTDYPSVNALAKAGHEIGVNSISAEANAGAWDVARWANETSGMREILSKFGLVNQSDILGSQGPYLQYGRQPMFTAISQEGFEYDSTEPIQNSLQYSPLWPYTLDSRAFPGLWELPLISLVSDGVNCATLTSCSNADTKEGAFLILQNNFLSHYNSNKAPFNIVIDPSWWVLPAPAKALNEFLNYVQTLEDVYVVTASQTFEWMKNPTSLKELSTLENWMNDQQPNVGDCSTTFNCHYSVPPTLGNQEHYVRFCSPCPPSYPWVGNVEGN